MLLNNSVESSLSRPCQWKVSILYPSSCILMKAKGFLCVHVFVCVCVCVCVCLCVNDWRCSKQYVNDWRCSEQGCQFVRRTCAGLVNHTRQTHSTAAQCRYRCVHCGKVYKKQGLTMHARYYIDNPGRRAA